MSDPTEDRFGPIDYVVVEFADGRPVSSGFKRLLDAVDRGAVRVLDLELVAKEGGQVRRVDPADFSDAAIGEFAGASSGLVGDDDLALLTTQLADGAAAVILVYEELIVLGVVDAWADEGGRLVSMGHLTPADLAVALDATDAN